MGVRSGRVRVADLAFRVFGRPVHPDWFAPVAHRRIAVGAWVADVRLIEGGHAVVWASGAARVSEILGGSDAPLPDQGLLHSSSLRRELSIRVDPGPGVEFQSCIEVERLDPEVFAHLADELTLDATPGDLFRRSRPAGRLDPAPLSRIHVDARKAGLSVQAFHTFPGEFAIVRTQSLFEVRGRSAR